MGRPLDRQLASKTLEEAYQSAEKSFREGASFKVPKAIADALAVPISHSNAMPSVPLLSLGVTIVFASLGI